MEDELIIGARKTVTPSKELLNLDRSYSLKGFEQHILHFSLDTVAPLVKEGNLNHLN
jgi:hypothetical protein